MMYKEKCYWKEQIKLNKAAVKYLKDKKKNKKLLINRKCWHLVLNKNNKNILLSQKLKRKKAIGKVTPKVILRIKELALNKKRKCILLNNKKLKTIKRKKQQNQSPRRLQ